MRQVQELGLEGRLGTRRARKGDHEGAMGRRDQILYDMARFGIVARCAGVGRTRHVMYNVTDVLLYNLICRELEVDVANNER